MNNRASDYILRVIGAMNGVRPYKWLPKLEAMQWYSSTQMAEWQGKELKCILHHAVDTVPYYRKSLASFKPSFESEGVQCLSRLPVLLKSQVRDEFEELRSTEPTVQRMQDITTSGSTGRPLHIRVDNEAFGRYFAAKLRGLRWYGVNFADRQLRVWGLAFAGNKRLYWKIRDRLQNRMRLVSFDLSSEKLDAFWPMLERFKPTYINGYTSAVQRLADYIEKSGKNGLCLNVKLVVPTAEMLYDWQREQMERVFGCPVMNEYGGCEIQAIAYACPSGTMHITHENMIVEVLDEDGLQVPDGTEGLLTITSLAARGMPMIRYQNGDVVIRRSGVHCPCGRHPGLPVLERIVGRSSDLLLRADGEPTHWTTMYYAIKDAFVPGMIIEHQAIQKALDRIEILVVKGPAYSDTAMGKFLARMKQVLGARMQIDLVFVNEIPREKSGKHRYFVSEIGSAHQNESTCNNR